MNSWIFLIFLLICFIYIHPSKATHIRAGEIIVERLSQTKYTYLIKLIIYADTKSSVIPGGGELSLGDGTTAGYTIEEGRIDLLDNDIAKYTFSIIHTYYGGLGEITIGYQEINRNQGIINMANSVNTPFYIETSFILETPCTINNTPVLLIPPIDYAAAGKYFVHNPGAYDMEGDSLSFELVIPHQSKTQVVQNYFFPEDLTLDPLSGELKWMVPNLTGEYNVAFAINEWRLVADSLVFLSRTIRDMQIIIIDNISNPPEIIIPADTCLMVGDLISSQISVQDVDNELVKLESFSQAFLLENSQATISPEIVTYEQVPFSKVFRWQTIEEHVMYQPYRIFFKATDNSDQDVPLVDIQTWRIKVSATAPENVHAALQNDGKIKISWDPYRYDAESIQIRRRVVGYEIPQGSCITGIPDYSSYNLITQTGGSNTEYVDTHYTGRFARGATYCYRLLARIPGCATTESAASEEVCIQIPVDAPVITNVSLSETDVQKGEIFIRWTSSCDIDTSLHNPANFSYKLQRAEGFTGKKNATIITPDHFLDTVFVDSHINTNDITYNYTVYLYENDILIDSSSTASTVRLYGDPVFDKIGLQWQAEVPWSNNTQQYPFHYIYRNRTSLSDPETLELIDSVNVNYEDSHYVDSGQFNQIKLEGEYCYYISTSGSYGNPHIIDPLINFSQIFCACTYDTIPPCSPELSILNSTEEDCHNFMNEQSCDFDDFFNDLHIMPGCEQDDIIGYNIYFAETPDIPFSYLAISDTEDFTHEGLSSFKGCYYVTAVDFSGNESDSSEIVCRDNCPYIELPNIFTPNNDGINDEFTEFNYRYDEVNGFNLCPRFINGVQLFIYNRYGKGIYSYDTENNGNFWIQWNGYDNSNRKIPVGVYYYHVEAFFDVINPEKSRKTFNGWIQVLY